MLLVLAICPWAQLNEMQPHVEVASVPMVLLSILFGGGVGDWHQLLPKLFLPCSNSLDRNFIYLTHCDSRREALDKNASYRTRVIQDRCVRRLVWLGKNSYGGGGGGGVMCTKKRRACKCMMMITGNCANWVCPLASLATARPLY
jgi:hypothetical protein